MKDIFTKKDVEKIDKRRKTQVIDDMCWAEEQDHPDTSTALNHIYSKKILVKKSSSFLCQKTCLY